MIPQRPRAAVAEGFIEERDLHTDVMKLRHCPLSLVLFILIVFLTALNSWLDGSNTVMMAVSHDLTPAYVRLWGSKNAYDVLGRKEIRIARPNQNVSTSFHAAAAIAADGSAIRQDEHVDMEKHTSTHVKEDKNLQSPSPKVSLTDTSDAVTPIRHNGVTARNIFFLCFRWVWVSFTCLTPGELFFTTLSIGMCMASMEQLCGSAQLLCIFMAAFALRPFIVFVILSLSIAGQNRTSSYVSLSTSFSGDGFNSFMDGLSRALFPPSAAWIAFFSFTLYVMVHRHTTSLFFPLSEKTVSLAVHAHLFLLSDYRLVTLPACLCAVILGRPSVQHWIMELRWISSSVLPKRRRREATAAASSPIPIGTPAEVSGSSSSNGIVNADTTETQAAAATPSPSTEQHSSAWVYFSRSFSTGTA